jgi:4-diphosphocytidyl-2-C-methyl-D-erythritol kinase
VKIRAPAKINFGLHIVGKRKDGYHLLDTVILPISLYDDLQIISVKRAAEKRTSLPKITVSCDHSLVPGGKKNLAYQAASLFLNEHRIDKHVHISIKKQIPVGAGLGGGSSDAAATLVGLNRLFRVKCPLKKLLQLAASLGADVPFFIRSVPARARGIGERLTPLRSFPRLWLVILYPGIPVSTESVYNNLRLKLTKPTANTSISTLLRNRNQLRRLLLVNDLEPVTIARYPRVGALKEKLIHEGASSALMSGSGSAVFGVFASLAEAGQAFRRLRKEKGVEVFLVRVLT